MAQASRTKIFAVKAEAMWSRVGGWGTIHEWHPAIVSTEVTEDGQVRKLTLGDGGVVIERLLDEGERSYAYRFEESPLPVTDYEARISVNPESDGCVVEWSGSFKPVGIGEAEAVELVEGIYQAGLDAL